jgi:hypothetical protein
MMPSGCRHGHIGGFSLKVPAKLIAAFGQGTKRRADP